MCQNKGYIFKINSNHGYLKGMQFVMQNILLHYLERIIWNIFCGFMCHILGYTVGWNPIFPQLNFKTFINNAIWLPDNTKVYYMETTWIDVGYVNNLVSVTNSGLLIKCPHFTLHSACLFWDGDEWVRERLLLHCL